MENDVDASAAKRARTVEPESFPLQHTSSPVRPAATTRALRWPISPVQSSKTQALSSCNLCSRFLTEKYDRILLEKGIKSFDAMAEIASLPFPLETIGSKYGCRNCVNKLKKRRTVITQMVDIETELKNLSKPTVSESETLTPVRAPVPEAQSTATIENDIIDCPTNSKKVVVTVTAKWPSKEERKNLPEELTSLGKMLLRGTYKQIANAAWKNEKIRKELMQLVRKEVERECTHLCSKKDPSCLRKTSREDMLAFSMDKLALELENRAPVLHSVLSAAAINRRSRAETTTPATRFGAVGMAAAVCLRNRSRYMIAVQFLITNFLYHSNWLVSIESLKL